MSVSPVRRGRRNLITDVAGIIVGNAEDAGARTGTTVLLADRRLVAAVDVRGGAPGTREVALLDTGSLVDRIDAIVLSGGSAFGLDAASGVTALLAAEGRGYRLRGQVVPIVPAAILFDLANGGDKAWGEEPPYRRLGRKAAQAAAADFRLGNAGAGLGAKAGVLKGGLGSASALDPATGCTVGALMAVNAVGSAVVPGGAAFWAFMLEQEGEFGGLPPPAGPVAMAVDLGLAGEHLPAAGQATTIGVVATDADLDRAEARRVAVMAQDGIARAIRPAHTPFDGDLLFAVATGSVPLAGSRPHGVARLGAIAADCVARAIARGVFEAESLGDRPSWRDVYRRHTGGAAS